MAQFLALVPLGFGAFKVYQNYTSSDDDKNPQAHLLRERGVIDRLTAGDNPPVGYFSEKHLEKMIKTNSACYKHADVLRAAREKANLGGKPKVPTAEHLEKMIKTNSVLKVYEDEMRANRAASSKGA